ncbi:unnamed protein product [Calypogeia fissa]
MGVTPVRSITTSDLAFVVGNLTSASLEPCLSSHGQEVDCSLKKQDAQQEQCGPVLAEIPVDGNHIIQTSTHGLKTTLGPQAQFLSCDGGDPTVFPNCAAPLYPMGPLEELRMQQQCTVEEQLRLMEENERMATMLEGLVSSVNGLSQKYDRLAKTVHDKLVRDKTSMMAACNTIRTSTRTGQDDAGTIGRWCDALASVGSTCFAQTRDYVVTMQQNEAVSPSPKQPPLALSPRNVIVGNGSVIKLRHSSMDGGANKDNGFPEGGPLVEPAGPESYSGDDALRNLQRKRVVNVASTLPLDSASFEAGKGIGQAKVGEVAANEPLCKVLGSS